MSDTAPQEEPRWELHHRLARSLEVARMKSADMGEHIGVSDRTMTNYLSGHTRPRDGVLRTWALRCGVPFDWLVGDEQPNPTGPRGRRRQESAPTKWSSLAA